MSTNYYWRSNICECCNRYDEQHVGKSSAGWSFTFQATDAIRSFDDWKSVFAKGGKLFDEYGTETSLDEFFKLVESKRGGWNHALQYPGSENWVDHQGHSFSLYEFS